MSQNWFEVSEPQDQRKNCPDIYAIQEPGHSEEVISYLIIGSEKAAMIDTGMGIANIKSVTRQYTKLPIQVINTHSHWDHIGGNHLFEEIAIHKIEAKEIELGVGHDFLKTQMTKEKIWRALPPDFHLKEYRIFPSNPTRLLQDGDIIDIGEYELTVFHLPGHSPGSICLWNHEFGHLFTGDVIYQGPLYAHLQGSNLQDYIISIKRLKSLLDSVEILFPAHNQTPLDRSFLEEVIKGFEKIKSNSVSLIEDETNNYYSFPRFRVLTPKRVL